MRFLGRSLTGLFLIAATIGLLAVAGDLVWGAIEARRAEEPQSRPARERVFAARVVEMTPEAIRPVLSTFGEVRARRALVLRASVGGEIIELADNFEEGGAVAAGDLLARIDPADAQSALDTARTDLAEAEADLAEAERAVILAGDDLRAAENQARLRARALDRQNDLLERGVGSQAAVETAELAVSSAEQAVVSRRQAEAAAEARLDQARTALERRRITVAEAERRLADTRIVAGFSGVLSDVQVVEGGLVTANERLADLIDPDDLEVAFRVSTSQYARLLTDGGRLIGAEITAAIDVLGFVIEAKGVISRESAVVGDGQTGRLLFARLDNPVGFRPGDFVSVKIQEPELTDVVRLPASSVDAAETVLVVGEEERLEVAGVTVLRREGNDIIVRAPDLTGREIVAERTPLLGAGIRVRPVRPGGEEVAPAAPETVTLDPDRRARLVAFVEASRMPAEVKERVLAQLQQDSVPAGVIERIESRMGG
ncbi:HlyD family efflux transporter periplasmic adaptor subunit [Alphaproteobacteria bacterium GH1-50]|uniref:HlyD family efflux transporter periplasmic adaptor subunit n=1 Tax=Kangsaoukella pontilimi TaxID=2691042 RepID=A0A7C9MF62_9RHOB|nr:HlyD family efflux transporter periplasmic adaptor subunit [Kangsaoukella pontilimi]MXQ09311.1 HlyD family efflux transporter periplasmic adaptor subunit [Kangsaoukella pontilimi]